MENKTNLKGLTLPELEAFVRDQGEKRFRASQLFAWIYRRNVIQFEDMTDISKSFRSRLAEVATIGALKVVQTVQSADSGTQKFLFELPDGQKIESVFMREEKRLTVCLSSQVGCALGCRFCATGSMGFYRNLESWEILEQFLAIQRRLQVKPSNVVIMGMGEPLLNYEAVIRACQLLNHPDGPAIGHRKIVISTSGIVPQIRRFATEHQPFKLAISLNAATDAQRIQIMPIAKKYPLAELMAAAREYARLSRLRVTLEYVLIAGFNDQPQDATNLKNLVHGLPCKINLIPYNNIQDPAQVPDNAAINQFFSHFKDFPAIVSVRWSKGTDIQAACGQLAVKTRLPQENSSVFSAE